MTPKGAHKALKKLESEEVIMPETIGNATIYHLRFESDFARTKAQIALFEHPSSTYVRVQSKDFERLRSYAMVAILFGSILKKGEQARDIDVLFIVEEKKYKELKKEIGILQKIKTKHIHAIFQTPEDFVRTLKKKDEVILDILRTGTILWGQNNIVESIAEVMIR
ncbi:hypothetical protein HY483_00945 [Candidatus Woesearchaeota archaeon]|nr:hypothetical protein [Candidatus Woesearchaeota archaeon]